MIKEGGINGHEKWEKEKNRTGEWGTKERQKHTAFSQYPAT
jgi:hypothetical protein